MRETNQVEEIGKRSDKKWIAHGETCGESRIDVHIIRWRREKEDLSSYKN